jgi:AraC-like DNA-binding protein
MDLNLLIYYYLLANGLILLLLSAYKFKRKPVIKFYLLQYLVLLLLAFELASMDYLFENLSFFCYPNLPIRFLLTPFIYLYVSTYTNPQYRPSRKTLLVLFLPAVAELLVFVGFCVYYYGHPHTAAERTLIAKNPVFHYTRTALALAFNLWLILRSYTKVQRFSWNILKTLSNLKKLRFGWLKAILGITVVLWVGWLAAFAAEWWYGPEALTTTLNDIWYGLIALVILVFGYLALLKPYVPEAYVKARKDIAAVQMQAATLSEDRPVALAATPTTDLPVEDNSQLIACFAQLQAYMEAEAAFVNPDITLADIGKTLNVSSFTLSKAIKACSEEGSFYEYINKRRLLFFLELLVLPENSSYTLVFLGQKAGFSSFTTLTKYCKKYTGNTPAKAKQLLQNGQNIADMLQKK